MAIEIEWKFVVLRLPSIPEAPHVDVIQGYLSEQGASVRVRVAGNEGYLTVKGSAKNGLGVGAPVSRQEFEYRIPLEDARQMLAMSSFFVQKRRYYLPGHVELDVFLGDHEGYIMAEVEVEEVGPVPEPPAGWEWRDVSSDRRYSNRAISENGFPPDTERATIGEG